MMRCHYLIHFFHTLSQISWCKVEATVDLCTKDADRIANGDQCNVQVLTDVELDTGKYPDHCRSSPPLVVLSYSMKTVMNYKMNVNEIVALSAIIFHQGMGQAVPGGFVDLLIITPH